MSLRLRKHLAAASAVAVIGGGLALAPAAQASAPEARSVQAATCLGGAKAYFKQEGDKFYPQTGKFKTSSRCNDIQIKPKTNRYVAVCIGKSSCRGSKLAKAGKWTVLASNVATGTDYYFSFRSTARSTGEYAV